MTTAPDPHETATGPQPIVSPFLTGAFAPVRNEHTASDLAVRGRIPQELDGLFTHIGPNPVRVPHHRDARSYQWFAQDGMVSGVRLRGGQAEWFRNRWIRSGRVTRALGEPRTPGRRRFPVDTVNTNVVAHGGRLLALIETGCTTVQLGQDLRTIRYDDRAGTLPRGLGAHPKIDPLTGELHALAYSSVHSWAEHTVLNAAGVLVRRHRIDLGGRPMLHDFALTDGHVLFFDSPVQFHLTDAMRGRFPYRWDEAHQTRLGVLPRRGDEPVKWFNIPPCFVFHTVTAQEDAGRLALRAVRYPRLFDSGGADPLSHGGQLWQWTVDLATATATQEQLDDHLQELPRTSPHTQLSGARYHYAITAGPEHVADHTPDALLKHDATLDTTTLRPSPRGAVPSEAVFVPAPTTPPRSGGGNPEDHGWILHWSYDPARDASDLIIFNAQDFTGPPQAIISLPIRVAFGFHSTWVPDTDLIGASSAKKSATATPLAHPPGAGPPVP